tara:strand:+ start:994 stop:1875 length:882 start_codon:yes stop_codon:yes gene_type:complete
MGNSAFYYSPHPDTSKVATQTIDLGETISDLQITPYRISHDAVSIGGRLSRVNRRVGLRARIILERFTDTELAEKLYTMGDHIERGGAVSFTVDTAKCYAAFVLSEADDFFASPTRGTYRMRAPLFDEYSSTAPASGDVLFVESFGPDAKREEVRVHSFNAVTRELQLSSPLKYNHQGSILIRHRDFFPVLFRSARNNEQAMLTHDHRISYTWDLTLECYSAHLLELYYSGRDAGTGASAGTIGLDAKVTGPVTTPVLFGREELTLPSMSRDEGGIRTEGSAIADVIDKMSKL